MITSAANPRVKALRQLAAKGKVRREEGVFLAEGARMVAETPQELLVAAYCGESFLLEEENRALAERLGAEVLTDSLFRSISDTVTPQGILALVRRQEHTLRELMAGGRPILVLEDIQDPGNLGTMLRTGEGAGIGGVLMSSRTVDLYNPKTVRATMGSLYRVPCVRSQDLAASLQTLRGAGYQLVAAHLRGEVPYTEADYSRPTAFLIGNEGNGLSEEIASLADLLVRIPMEGQVESLNAAIAATLLIYESFRQNSFNY